MWYLCEKQFTNLADGMTNTCVLSQPRVRHRSKRSKPIGKKRWGSKDSCPGLWCSGCWLLWRCESHLGTPTSTESARPLYRYSGHSMGCAPTFHKSSPKKQCKMSWAPSAWMSAEEGHWMHKDVINISGFYSFWLQPQNTSKANIPSAVKHHLFFVVVHN